MNLVRTIIIFTKKILDCQKITKILKIPNFHYDLKAIWFSFVNLEILTCFYIF